MGVTGLFTFILMGLLAIEVTARAQERNQCLVDRQSSDGGCPTGECKHDCADGEDSSGSCGADSMCKCCHPVGRDGQTPVEARRPVVPVEARRPVIPVEARRPVTVPVEARRPVTAPVENRRPVLPVEARRPVAVPVEARRPVTLPVEARRPVTVPVESRRPLLPVEARRPVVPVESRRPVTVPVEARRPVTVPVEARRPVTVPVEARRPVTVAVEAHRPVAKQEESRRTKRNVEGQCDLRTCKGESMPFFGGLGLCKDACEENEASVGSCSHNESCHCCVPNVKIQVKDSKKAE